MGAFVLGIPEHKLRVVAPDVGGGFGSKIFHYAEEAFVTWAAKAVGRPVKWTSTAVRGVHLRRARPRPRHQDRAGARRGRQVPGAARPTRSPTWAPTSRPSRPASRPTSTARCWPGTTRRRRSTWRCKAVFTNTVPVDAYRGAGRPEATYLLERLVDKAAREIGHRPGGDPAAELHQARPVPLPDAGRAALRHRRLPRDAGQARWRSSDCAGFEARRAESEGARQAARLRHRRPTSRPAASRRRASSARSARAPGSTRARRCG